MIKKIYDSNKYFMFIFVIISIMLLSDSCSPPRRGMYYKRSNNSSLSYNIRNRTHYRAKRNSQPIAKNYRIKNSRSSGRY